MASEGENTTNLIINYLPQALTDAEFNNLFLPMGPVKSIKICRDKATNYSYGFGFVDYQDPEDAQRAINELNGKQVINKKIKVALARPSGSNIKGANVYVKNLPKQYSDEKVREIFSEFGNIVQVKVLRDSKTGESKTVGFILFDTKPEAERAVNGMNGKTLTGGDGPLIVKLSGVEQRINKAGGGQRNGPGPMFGPRMMAPNMPYDFGNGYGNDMGDFTGPMRNTPMNRFRYNPMSQQQPSPGFNPNPNSRYNPNYYMDTFSDDKPDMHRQASGGYTLFVHNVGFDCQQRDLYRLFAPYGALLKVDVIWDKDKDQCKGYAFVTFVNSFEAANAVNMLNGSWYNGRQLQVSFKK